MLRRLGAVVVSADEVGHRVLEPGGAAYAAVVRRWPDVVVDGRIDRARLAGIVFNDPRELAVLEAMTHPAIGERLRSLAEAAGDRPVVVELPVLADLLGPGWVRIFVDAPAGLRKERALARGGDPADVTRRMAVQPSREQWLAWADRVIVNDADLATLERRVRELWDDLTGERHR